MPHGGINGSYLRTGEHIHGRAIYDKQQEESGKVGTAMWWANNNGKLVWCVGPKNKVGTSSMWAYVEGSGGCIVCIHAEVVYACILCVYLVMFVINCDITEGLIISDHISSRSHLLCASHIMHVISRCSTPFPPSPLRPLLSSFPFFPTWRAGVRE